MLKHTTLDLLVHAASALSDRACVKMIREVLSKPQPAMHPTDIRHVLYAFTWQRRWYLAVHALATLDAAGHAGAMRYSVAAWGPSYMEASKLLKKDALDGDKVFALVSSCRDGFESAAAEKVIADYEASGVCLEPRHFAVWMRCYPVATQAEKVDAVLARAEAAGAANAHVHTAYIAVYATAATSPRDGYVVAAERVWADAMRRGAVHMRHKWLWVALMKVYKRSGDVRSARALRRLAQTYAAEHRMSFILSKAFEQQYKWCLEAHVVSPEEADGGGCSDPAVATPTTATALPSTADILDAFDGAVTVSVRDM